MSYENRPPISYGRGIRLLSRIVLSLYGAVLLPEEENPQSDVGTVADGGGTLVLADPPTRPTGRASLKRAIALRDSPMIHCDRAVVLGWNFEAGIDSDIAALGDTRLEIRVIPTDLFDRLQQAGSLQELCGRVDFPLLAEVTTAAR